MLQLLSLLLLFIPTIFQYIIGNKSIYKSINISLVGICVISLILQFVITIMSFLLSIYAMTHREGGNGCATGAVGIFFFSFVITVFMILVMLLQFSRRKRHNKELMNKNE